MGIHRSLGRWRRWSVTALGSLLCGLLVVFFLGVTTLEQLHLGLPAFLALGLAAYGGWLVHRELSAERITRIALWSLVGTVVLGLFGTWEMYLHLLEGRTLAGSIRELLFAGMNGAVVGGVVGYYDVQQREHHREAERAKQAVSVSSDGIALLDENRRYVKANRAYTNLYGYDNPEDVIGKSWQAHHTEKMCVDFEERILPTLKTEGEWRGETVGKRTDGSSFPQEVTMTTLNGGGVLTVVRDITDRRQRERELERKTDLLKTTQRIATVGGWELDLQDDELRWTDEMYRIHELPLDYEPELESALEFFHPEDVQMLEDAIDQGIEDGESYDVELRFVTAEGSLRCVRALGEPHFENGETVMLSGVLQDITERKRHVQALEEAEGRFRALTESADFGVVTIDEDSTITYTNDAVEDILGYPPKEVEGDSLTKLMPESHQEKHQKGIQRYLREGVRSMDWEWVEFPGQHREGHEVPLGISFGETQLEDGTLFTGILRDITERTEHEDRLASLHKASRQLMYTRTPDEVASVTVEIASEILDKPLSAIWFYDDESDRLVPTAFSDSSQEFLDGAGITELPPLGEEHIAMDVFRDGELAVIEDYQTFENPMYSNLPLRTVLIVPIGNHGILVLGTKSVDEVAETDRHQINMLTLNAQTALDRAQREQTLTRRQEMIEALHTTTREMVRAVDTEDICEIAVGAAEGLLNLPITAIWLSDDTGQRLNPVAQSAEGDAVIGEPPIYTAEGESLSWQAFESGETKVYDDLQSETSPVNTETPIRSEIIVPLGDHGVMNFGSPTVNSFDETDVRIAELLAENTVTAFERVEREQVLETQLDRMEFFNSILRHDVLNGMTVIRGRAEFLADELAGDQLRDAETILNWCVDIVEIVQRIRTILDALTSTSDIPLEPIELCETLEKELGRVRETYPEVTFETAFPDSVHVQANELLSEVLGNIITNAVDHNDTEGLCVSITATERTDDNTAIVRIADNGNGVSDEAKERIFRRDTTSHAKSSGSGFGLFFVDIMVESYGGDIWVKDNDAGGATFVIELPLAEGTAAG